MVGIGICGAGLDELPMSAVSQELPLLKKKNSGHLTEQIDTMRHEHGSAQALGRSLDDRVMNQGFALWLHRCRRLIEQKNSGLCQKGPGQAESLPLPP